MFSSAQGLLLHAQIFVASCGSTPVVKLQTRPGHYPYFYFALLRLVGFHHSGGSGLHLCCFSLKIGDGPRHCDGVTCKWHHPPKWRIVDLGGLLFFEQRTIRDPCIGAVCIYKQR